MSRVVTRPLLSTELVVSVIKRTALEYPSLRRACLLVRGAVVESRFSDALVTAVPRVTCEEVREHPHVGPPFFPLGTKQQIFSAIQYFPTQSEPIAEYRMGLVCPLFDWIRYSALGSTVLTLQSVCVLINHLR
jgi:hypothetical protein